MVSLLLLFFIVSLTLQIILFTWIFPKILNPQLSTSETIEPVSVIIAAHNEFENLKHLLPLLLAQTHPSYEIIIANDRSKDGTESYLKTHKNPKLQILHISETPDGIHPKKYAITKAIEVAKNELLLFTDADCLPASDKWILRMQQCFTSGKDIVLGYSPYDIKSGWLNRFIRFETILTAIQYLAFALINRPYMGVGRNLAYRKSLFVRVNGFGADSAITGGDDDLFVGKTANKHNVAICLSPDSFIYSKPKTSLKSYFRQKLRHLSVGKSYSYQNKLVSSLYPVSSIGFYLTTICLLCLWANFSVILTLFILRTIILITIFALITRKLDDPIKWYWIPVLDFIYFMYYLITGFKAVFSKSIKWI